MAEPSTVGQRISHLIQSLGLSKNAFAISLDKTATVVQHLVEERNKPGFDLLCKIFDVYPNVSKDWLLQGNGPMWASEAPATPREISTVAAVLASAAPAAALPTEEVAPTPVQPPSVVAPAPLAQAIASPAPAAPIPEQMPLPAASGAAPPPAEPAPQPVAPTASAAPVAEAAAWQTALYTQQMAHQLALAELRNQHMQEQQRLMQQMMDLLQQQLGK